MTDDVCAVRDDEVTGYPDAGELFRPSEPYPEYHYTTFAKKTNKVYGLVREALHQLELDNDNYNTPSWNPFGEFVLPGDFVLIKPNLVMDRNLNLNADVNCLYTHPSITAAVVDYVIIAQKGRGKIIIGDAPVQECDFENLIYSSGYAKLVDFYRKLGIDICLKDFRERKTYVEDGIRYVQEGSAVEENGIVVRIDNNSAFADLAKERMERLRVTNFDPRIMSMHHNEEYHEYKIAKELLQADVIINIPKPKTHRKAGITGALKNMVGISSSKEYLPHHTLGSLTEGGDAYKSSNANLSDANNFLDEKNCLIADGKYNEAKAKMLKYEHALKRGRLESGERYWEGSWYGNDTIWRSVSDLNKIILYADKNGTLCDSRQRRYFALGDMIVSGEKEGPLWPTPKICSTIVASRNPIAFDRTICSIMGFDYRLIHPLLGEEICEGKYSLPMPVQNTIISNYELWDGKSLDDLREYESLGFQPTKGWEYLLGNPVKEKIYQGLVEEDRPIIIFGAGETGIDLVYYFAEKNSNINILCFFDNDESKWGKQVTSGLYCRKPKCVNGEEVCVVAANQNNMKDIVKNLDTYKFARVICWPD